MTMLSYEFIFSDHMSTSRHSHQDMIMMISHKPARMRYGYDMNKYVNRNCCHNKSYAT